MILPNGATDVTRYFVLRDSTTHEPKTDVTITDIDIYYIEQGAAMAAKVDATALAAADSAHADNQAFHCGLGVYRIDWPDAAFDGGVGKHVILIVVCTGVDTTFLEVELSPPSDATLNATQGSYAPAKAGDQMTLPDGGITAAKIATDALTAAKVSADLITAIQSGLSTYDGSDTSGTTTLLSRLSALRAGYIDKLNISGNVAGSEEVTAIQNNTRVVRVVPTVIERPDSGTQTYRIELLLYDAVGNMESPDSAPTIALVNQAGTDLSARLDSATMSLVSTGHYRAVYTADDEDDLEQLVWTFSVVEGGATRSYGNTSLIVDTTAVDFTAADRTKLEALNSDWTDGGRLDLILDLILEDTGTTLAGLMAASAIRAALGLGSANADTQLAAILAQATLARKLKSGNVRSKPGEPTIREVLDDDGSTPIAEVVLSETTPFVDVTLL